MSVRPLLILGLSMIGLGWSNGCSSSDAAPPATCTGDACNADAAAPPPTVVDTARADAGDAADADAGPKVSIAEYFRAHNTAYCKAQLECCALEQLPLLYPDAPTAVTDVATCLEERNRQVAGYIATVEAEISAGAATFDSALADKCLGVERTDLYVCTDPYPAMKLHECTADAMRYGTKTLDQACTHDKECSRDFYCYRAGAPDAVCKTRAGFNEPCSASGVVVRCARDLGCFVDTCGPIQETAGVGCAPNEPYWCVMKECVPGPGVEAVCAPIPDVRGAVCRP